jgi:hypothetical protein
VEESAGKGNGGAPSARPRDDRRDRPGRIDAGLAVGESLGAWGLPVVLRHSTSFRSPARAVDSRWSPARAVRFP